MNSTKQCLQKLFVPSNILQFCKLLKFFHLLYCLHEHQNFISFFLCWTCYSLLHWFSHGNEDGNVIRAQDMNDLNVQLGLKSKLFIESAD